MPATPKPVRKQHTPLKAIDSLGPAITRDVGQVRDIPGRRPAKPITFDSAL
ncbi:hypothetical protein [Streptomyces sp. NPDC058466]|uniref:hypothetical protein n=1 Tax=Streptomyces sp. NPDC058466 TaxID=3346512 RepID=UPI003651BAFE